MQNPAVVNYEIDPSQYQHWSVKYEGETATCTSCHGARLNPISRAVLWRDKSIAELAGLAAAHDEDDGESGGRQQAKDEEADDDASESGGDGPVRSVGDATRRGNTP